MTADDANRARRGEPLRTKSPSLPACLGDDAMRCAGGSRQLAASQRRVQIGGAHTNRARRRCRRSRLSSSATSTSRASPPAPRKRQMASGVGMEGRPQRAWVHGCSACPPYSYSPQGAQSTGGTLVSRGGGASHPPFKLKGQSQTGSSDSRGFRGNPCSSACCRLARPRDMAVACLTPCCDRPRPSEI